MWEGLSNADPDGLPGAVVILLLTTLVGVSGYILKTGIEWITAWLRAARERRRALIDFAIEIQRRRLNLDRSFSAEYFESLKERIPDFPDDGPLYVLKMTSQRLFDRMAQHKHSFSERDAALLDTYIAFARVWDQHYEKLGSEEFGRLSIERKIAVIDNFIRAGDNVRLLGDRVLDQIGELRELAKLCRVDDLKSSEDPLAGTMPSKDPLAGPIPPAGG